MYYYYQKYEGLVHDLPYDIRIAKNNNDTEKVTQLEKELIRAKERLEYLSEYK